MKDKKAYKRRKKEVKFSDKRHPLLSIVSLFLGIGSFLIMAGLIVFSALEGGQGPFYMGALGMAAILFTLAGFILAIRSFRGDNIYYRIPVASSAVNGVFLILFIFLYTLGFI